MSFRPFFFEGGVVKIYSLRDSKAEEFGGLMLAPNVEIVYRGLRQGIPSNSPVGQYPEDYDLYFVGEFDMETGWLTSVPPQSLGNVLSIIGGKDNA